MYDPVEVATVENQRCCKQCYASATDERTREVRAEHALFPEVETHEMKKIQEELERKEREEDDERERSLNATIINIDQTDEDFFSSLMGGGRRWWK